MKDAPLPFNDQSPEPELRGEVTVEASAPTPARPRARRRLVGIEAHQRRQSQIRYGLLFISAAFMINALVGDNGMLATMKARKQAQTIQRQLNALREDNQRLKIEMTRLKNDPSAVEEEARKNLGLIRPGETLVVIKDAQPAK